MMREEFGACCARSTIEHPESLLKLNDYGSHVVKDGNTADVAIFSHE